MSCAEATHNREIMARDKDRETERADGKTIGKDSVIFPETYSHGPKEENKKSFRRRGERK